VCGGKKEDCLKPPVLQARNKFASGGKNIIKGGGGGSFFGQNMTWRDGGRVDKTGPYGGAGSTQTKTSAKNPSLKTLKGEKKSTSSTLRPRPTAEKKREGREEPLSLPAIPAAKRPLRRDEKAMGWAFKEKVQRDRKETHLHLPKN